MDTKTRAKQAVDPHPLHHKVSTPDLAYLGKRLRLERNRQGISLREVARRVNVSPSMISQIENGLVMPSVSTLWSLATIFKMSIDELFSHSKRVRTQTRVDNRNPPGAEGPVQRGDSRERLRLAGGVLWERLTARPEDEVEFLYVVYAVGAESCPEDSLFRHGGKEYAYVISGRLGLQIGFEKYELKAGDSISFSAHQPHRLWAIGNEPAVAIWVILNRRNDDRIGNRGSG
ncbi:MAG: helix-turn-helix transcriptional regulator [Gammaproteobacteria bacterium]|nr:helix-turn-helix transcriptional regulator [Gammaproteobacteria bacterium]